jgi:tetratricopeptide (TPR) repeat protein
MLTVHRRVVLCIAVGAFAASLYLNALDNPFVYDDFRVVLENTSIVDLRDLKAIIILEPTRPLVNFTYAVDRAIWGENPFGFHLTNVLVHVLNVLLLFALAGRVAEDLAPRGPLSADTRRDAVSVTAAALFAAHPLLSQAVGYVAARPELLCGAFFLGALLSGRRWLLGGSRRWAVLTVMLWIGAVTSKEVGGMFPFVLFMYERLVLRLPADGRARALKGLHGVLIGLSALAIATRIVVLALVQYPGEAVVHWEFLPTQLDVILRYLGLLIAPRGQRVFHAVPLATLGDPWTWLSIAVVSTLVAGAIVVRHRAPMVPLALGWFLLLLAPSVVLVLLDRGEPMAEHRVYVASMGFFLAAGAGVGRMLQVLDGGRARLRWMMYALLVVAVAGLAGRTVLRNLTWSSPVALWSEAVQGAPDHWLPLLLLGEALHAAGRREEAIRAYQEVLDLRPEEVAAYQKLALALVEAGRREEARAVFLRLGERDPRSPVVTNGLGVLALIGGKRDEARAHFLESMARDPGNVGARQALAAMAEEPPGDFAEALRLCREIQQLAPRTPGNDDCIRRNQVRLSAPPSRP